VEAHEQAARAPTSVAAVIVATAAYGTKEGRRPNMAATRNLDTE
jgi:hypothetical protein